MDKTLDWYLTFDYSKNISLWTLSLNLTMAEEIKKQLTTMWEKGGIEFNNFEFVTWQQCDKIMQNTPKKYEKKIAASTFLMEQNSSDSSTVESTKNYTKQGVEANCWAKILHYKSSQNKKAKAIYDLINTRYNRAIDWVRLFL